MCETRPLVPRRGDEYVRWVQDLRRSGASRPYGSLRKNRQNERRAAVERSRREN